MGDFEEAQLGRFLKLLGFHQWNDGPDISFKNGELFKHPNPNLFQKISYFLCLMLDPDQTKVVFHDCWPVLERKQELNFRKMLYKFYVEARSKSDGTLNPVNPALFLSPVGKKAVRFLLEYVSYIIKAKIKAMEPSWQMPSLDIDVDEDFLNTKALIEARQDYVIQAQDMTKQCVNEFQQVRAQVLNCQTKVQHSLAEASNTICMSLKSVDELREECLARKNKLETLMEDCSSNLASAASSLQTINAFASVDSGSRDNFVNVSATALENETFHELFSRLLTSAFSIVKDLKHVEAFKPELPSTMNFEQHVDSLAKRNKVIQEQHLPALDASLKDSDDALKQDINTCLLPVPLTTLNISFSGGKCSGKYTIQSCQSRRSQPSALPLSTPVRRVSEEVVEAQDAVTNLFMPSFEALGVSDPKISTSDSCSEPSVLMAANNIRPLTKPRSGAAPSTGQADDNKADETKMSVFSPILSSSRMEVTLPTCSSSSPNRSLYSELMNESVALKESKAPAGKKRFHLTLPSTPELDQICADESDHKENQLPNSNFSRLMKFKPITLSPSFLQPISPETNSDKKISSRLQDMMATLTMEDSAVEEGDDDLALPDIDMKD